MSETSPHDKLFVGKIESGCKKARLARGIKERREGERAGEEGEFSGLVGGLASRGIDTVELEREEKEQQS